MLYIGCPMWGYKDWVGDFFPARTPQGDFLQVYSQRLLTVEGNTIFYALPTPETILHWTQMTPASFRFCPKVSRSISHEPDISIKKDEVRVFTDRMRIFGERLGPIFLQLAPTFQPKQIEQLQAFLAAWPQDLRLAVEVRHPDFYVGPAEEHLNALLQHYHVARVIMDTRPIQKGPADELKVMQARERKPLLPVPITTTTDFAFVRYIGHPRMEMNLELLDQWAQQIALWLKADITVYTFCHCPFEEHSPAICFELYQRVKALVAIPALSWTPSNEDDKPEQMRLF